jgi:hypothetical protein
MAIFDIRERSTHYMNQSNTAIYKHKIIPREYSLVIITC